MNFGSGALSWLTDDSSLPLGNFNSTHTSFFVPTEVPTADEKKPHLAASLSETAEILEVPTEECQCLEMLRQFYQDTQYADCVEYGLHLLASTHEIPLALSLEVLHVLGNSFIHCCELEKARGTFELLKQAIQVMFPPNHPMCARQRVKWLIRYYKDTAWVNEADGHREEAVQDYAEAWRLEADLYGPQSAIALTTYVAIADLYDALNHCTVALRMLKQAEENLLDPNDAIFVWTKIKTATAEIEYRKRDSVAAFAQLDELLERLQQLLKMERSSAPMFSPAEWKSLMLVYGGALLTYADVALLGRGGNSKTRAPCSIEDWSSISQDTQNEDALMWMEKALQCVTDAESVFAQVLSSSDVLNVRTQIKKAQVKDLLRQRSSEGSSVRQGAQQLIADLHAIRDTLFQAEVRGAKHPYLLVEVFEALGEAYVREKKYKEAGDAFQKTLSAAQQLYAPDHEVPAILQHKLAEAFLSSGRYDDAYHLLKELQQWCMDCPTNKMAPLPLFVLHHSLGNCMRLMERFPEALQYYKDALSGSDGGAIGESKARILGSIASLKLTLGQIDEAISLNRQALHVRIEEHGLNHLHVASSYGNLASLYCAKKCDKEAIEAADRCIHIVTEHVMKSQRGPQQTSSSVVGGKRPAVVVAHPLLLRQHSFYTEASHIRALCTRRRKATQFQKILDLPK